MSNKKAVAKRWRQSPEGKRNQLKQDLKKRYNLTLEEYDDLLDKQGGVCYICLGINKDGRRLAVDHNHLSGKVRKLLCMSCNLIIGHSKENIGILLKIVDYLKNE